LRPPAKNARRVALALSIVAVLASIACGFFARRAYAVRDTETEYLVPFGWFLLLLLVALLLRMGAAICELIWLARVWGNLPEGLRRIGPLTQVEPILLITGTLVPGLAWIWKLGVIDTVTKGFEAIRTQVPYDAPVPRRLGMAAVIVGWIPGLNVYVAPFLWELFAIRIDRCVELIVAQGSHAVPNRS
jgi:hypothetical protein